MFAHLKRVREMEFDRESDSGSSNTSPVAKVEIPGFSKVDELQDDKEESTYSTTMAFCEIWC